MKHKFTSDFKEKCLKVFIDKPSISTALNQGNLFLTRNLMQEYELDLQQKLELEVNHTWEHNIKVKKLKNVRECYTVVENTILYYLDDSDRKLNYDINV